MKLVSTNGTWYIVTNTTKTEINEKVVKVFKECYQNIPEEKMSYMLLCNKLMNLPRQYETNLFIKDGAVKFKVLERITNEITRTIAGKTELVEILNLSKVNTMPIFEERKEEDQKQPEPTPQKEGKQPEKKPKIKVFKKMKEFKNKKLKVVATTAVSGIFVAAVALSLFNLPYKIHNDNIDTYVDSHRIEATNTGDTTFNNVQDIGYLPQNNVEENTQDTVSDEVVKQEETKPNEQEVVRPEDNLEYTECPYQFDENVVAYIESPTLLDRTYPVMQASDNDYYLTHDMYGNETQFGEIYKDYRNDNGLSDDFTIIYGHNLRDNSMFGIMSEMSDLTEGGVEVRDGQSLYEQSNVIYYTDEYGRYEVQIFASGVYDGSEIVNFAGDYTSEEDFNQKMNVILSNSDISSDIEVEPGSKIIAFQSCPDGTSDEYGGNNRVYNFGVAHQIEKYKDLPSGYYNGIVR